MDLLIVDDCKTVRSMVRLLVRQLPDVRVVGMADSAASALAQIAAKRPQVITLDLNLPDACGIDLLRQLTAASTRDMQIVVLTGSSDQEAMALANGASACFDKMNLLRHLERFFQALLRPTKKGRPSRRNTRLKVPAA